jgi:outer membrane protein
LLNALLHINDPDFKDFTAPGGGGGPKKSKVLSANAKREREKELIQKDQDLRELGRKKEEEMQKDEYNAMQPILNELFDITKKLAKEERYTMILEFKSRVVYSDKPVEDITEKVIRLANEPKKEGIKK